MENLRDNVISWIKRNRFEAFLLAVILLTASYFRLYKIDGYMTFLGDEGRDAIVVRRLLVDFDPILVGPGTSIGNMYLGPLYYYLMAPFLLLADFSPVGPSVMVALFGIATVFFVWFTGREWFGRTAALISSTLFAISPVVITYSRSSWNPNIMPFFSLLSIYSIWRVWNYHETKWLAVLGISYAFCLQSHYLALLLAPVLFIFWILAFLNKGNLKNKTSLLKHSVLGGVFFLILMSPLVIFDARHGWRNFAAINTFFSVRQETVSARPWTAFPKITPIWEKISNRLLAGYNQSFANFLSYFSLIFVASYLVVSVNKLKTALQKPDKDRSLRAFLLLFFWLSVALTGFGVYKQEIYDHYFGFIFAGVFLLMGGIFQKIFDSNKFIGGVLIGALIPPLIYLNIQKNPLKNPPNNQMKRTENVAKKIIEESDSREFNLAVIAERNYEGAYQYFLEKFDAPLVIIDPQTADKTITSQLFVVCELPEEKCDPTHDPKAGIANFGWSKIANSWEIDGTVLYKLVHY